MTTPRPLPLWSYLLVDPRAVAASLDRVRAAGLVPDVPNLWQVSLGVARMVHRLLFRPDSVGLSTDAPARTSLRARLLRVRPLRFPFLLAAGAVTPLDLSGLASPRDRVMAHLLGAHHDRRQFVYDLQILAAHPGALEELLARARAVASGDDPRAAWLKDLVVYEGYHERLVAAVRAALDGEHGLTPEEAADPDVSFLAYLRWCAAQPASPAATWRALRAGEFALDRDRLGVAA